MRVERGSVRLVTLYDDEHGFSPNYVTSLLAMIGHDLVNQQRIARGGWTLKHAKSYDIAAARNEATAEFLESDVEWLLFVDSDMGWDADALDRLFDHADAQQRPIVGGLCFGYSPVETGTAEANGPFRYPFPTLYWFNETETDIGFQIMWNYRAGALNAVYRQELLTSNLANVNTVGFKADTPITRQRDPARIEDGLASLPSSDLLERLGAGVMAAPIYTVSPLMGADLIIVVFAVVVIGGMGSIMGSIVTGFALGVVEGLTKVFYPEASNTVIFVIMAIVLLIRPTGLFGRG